MLVINKMRAEKGLLNVATRSSLLPLKSSFGGTVNENLIGSHSIENEMRDTGDNELEPTLF
jgi:hypothetical protein